jgi:bifunctional oligoribonuclease and PAP phosphatase NrnA
MFQKIKEILNNGKRFLVVTHIDPDGDAVGSAFALGFAIETLAKEVSVYLKDRVPYRYAFLPQPRGLVHEIPEGTFDAVFTVDCGDFFRVGNGHEKLKEKGPIINIDHHDTNEAFGYINILDERASSTAELIYLVLKGLGIPIDADMAINIYTGIFTDTGSFRYDNTNTKAFIICEEMTHKGVVPSYVASKVHESHPRERFVLLCTVLSTLQMYYDNRVAVVHVTADMFREAGASREHSEGFVEFIKEMKDLEVAALLRQIGEGRYKISMRSKGTVDVASIAARFGGGGHKNAAGCVMEGTLEEIRTRLVGAIGL